MSVMNPSSTELTDEIFANWLQLLPDSSDVHVQSSVHIQVVLGKKLLEFIFSMTFTITEKFQDLLLSLCIFRHCQNPSRAMLA